MSINRRLFLKSSCGAVVAVVASQSLFSQLFSETDSLVSLVRDTVRKRFPRETLNDEGVQQFAELMARRGFSRAGTSGTALADIMDDGVPTVSFDRYVVREFLLNTNYLEQRAQADSVLQVIPFRATAMA